ASLKKANFKDADLGWASFYKADLSEADLRGETSGNLRLSSTNLTKANLEGDKFSTDFGCIYRGANLKGCQITGSVFECDFSGANLCGANLRAVGTPTKTRWKGAIYDEDTAFPDGFDPAAAGM